MCGQCIVFDEMTRVNMGKLISHLLIVWESSLTDVRSIVLIGVHLKGDC